MRNRHRAVALAAALLLAASHPALVRAEADTSSSSDGLGRLMRYSACALATFLATTPTSMGQALIGCGLIYLDEVGSSNP